MIPAHGAVFQGLAVRLLGSSVCGTRVYADSAPRDAAMPFFVFSFVSSNRNRELGRTRMSVVVVGVRCVARTKVEAMLGAGWCVDVLDNQGAQESATPVPSVAGWGFNTISEETAISSTEYIDGVEPVYIEGSTYRIVLEVE